MLPFSHLFAAQAPIDLHSEEKSKKNLTLEAGTKANNS